MAILIYVIWSNLYCHVPTSAFPEQTDSTRKGAEDESTRWEDAIWSLLVASRSRSLQPIFETLRSARRLSGHLLSLEASIKIGHGLEVWTPSSIFTKTRWHLWVSKPFLYCTPRLSTLNSKKVVLLFEPEQHFAEVRLEIDLWDSTSM